MTIYLPDDLAAEVKDKLGDTNISAVCQDALRDELRRHEARAKITAEGFERVEVYDGQTGERVAFRGRRIGYTDNHDQTAYLTAGGAIAIYNGDQERLYVIDEYADLDPEQEDPALMAGIAAALGEKYVRDLDI